MSKALIEALIKLFAIVAKVDGITDDERDKARLILRNQLNEDLADEYMQLFDKEVDELLNDERHRTDAEIIEEVCTELNKELTRHQKIAVLVQLTAIMLADGIIADQEVELIEACSRLST